MSRMLARRIAVVAAVAVTLLTAPVGAYAAPATAGQGPAAIAPHKGFPLTLATDSTNLWPTQQAHLTATANSDPTNNQFYIMVYEITGAKRLMGWCNVGRTCTVPVTSATPGVMSYEADIAAVPTNTYPPQNIMTKTAPVQIEWQGAEVRLSAHPPTAGSGESVTLRATTESYDQLGPSPFFVEIYDATTGTPLAICPQETCSYTVSLAAAATHRYVAYTTAYSLTFPPATIQTISGSVWATWRTSGWTVQLAKTSDGDVKAVANLDVGTTPYMINIFLEQDNADGTAATGSLVASCRIGRTCTVDGRDVPSRGTLVAFVSDPTSVFPPTGIQAVSPLNYDGRQQW